MGAYYLFEWKAFIRNKKNIAVFILLLLSTLYYSFVISPRDELVERVDAQTIAQEYEEKSYWLDNYSGEVMSSGVAFALGYFPTLVELNEERLDALEQNDFNAYAAATAEWYLYEDSYIYNMPIFLSYNHAYYGIDQAYPLEEGRYWYMDTANRYNAYLENDTPLSIRVLDERTALQAGYQMLNKAIVPFILLGVVVVFSNDIVTKDRTHLTLIKSFPFSFEAKLWVKTAVLMTNFFIVSLFMLLTFLVITGIREGFGSFTIPVSIFEGPTLAEENFSTLSLGQFYLQATVLFLLIAFIFTRIVILFSLLVKNEYFNLITGIALLFLERLYYMRGIGYFSKLDLLPPTFFPVGSVLSGYQNHLYNSSSINFTNGVFSLMVVLIAVEMTLFILNRFKAIRSLI